LLAQWHIKVKELADIYNAKEVQRINISNFAYLELMEQYQKYYNNKKSLIELQIERYNEGVNCVKMSSDMIKKFALDLDLAKPQLEATKKEINIVIKVLLS